MPKSGFQRRQERVARGLPRYTPGEEASRKERDKRRTPVRRRFLVAKIAAYKVACGCADCGYNAHAVALDFDHLPQFEKQQSISRLVLFAQAWSTIEKEMAKCEVVCANCHRVRTAHRLLDEGSQGVAALELQNERE